MPKAPDRRRKAFASALQRAMSARAKALGIDGRMDEWLADKVGQSSQSIRNYLSESRQPQHETIIEAMEDALDLERHELGRHLGYGPTDDDRISQLEGVVADLVAKVDLMNSALEALSPPVARRRRPTT